MKIYLTIDDAPSKHTRSKIEILKEYNIPAVFFCRGDSMNTADGMATTKYIIENGFLIGNHAYSHNFFSKLSKEEIIEEIEKTEHLIEQAYEEAGIKRPIKIIRFPYGDGGKEEVKNDIQQYLDEQGFSSINFPNVDWQQPIDEGSARFMPVLWPQGVDIRWTCDVYEYKTKSLPERNPLKLFSIEDILNRLDQYFEENKDTTQVILTHDFNEYDHAKFFPEIIKTMRANQVEFLQFPGLQYKQDNNNEPTPQARRFQLTG